MAIGARGGDILLQFLFEAIALCTLGGLIGMAIGWIGVLGYARGLSSPDGGLSDHHRDCTWGCGLGRSDIWLLPRPQGSSTRSNPGAQI